LGPLRAFSVKAGPSIGLDAGANGGNTFILVYNLHGTQDLYERFPSAEGIAYISGGFNASFLRLSRLKGCKQNVRQTSEKAASTIYASRSLPMISSGLCFLAIPFLLRD
jgi:hypothetical protein